MTVVQPNSIAGINSISVQSGQSLSIHKSDGTLIREIVASTGISTFSSISVGSATTTNSAAKSINIGLGASISQHDANTLSFGTNGDERLKIESNGDVTLTNTSSNPQLAIISAADGIGEIQFGDTADAVRGNILYRSGSAGDALCFNGYNNTERLRITSGGQVGIASATPTSGFILDVGGDVTIGEPKGNGNSFIDQKEDGDLHIINSGRTANGASGSPGTAGVGINRFNTRAGGTSLFRDFCVYNGKDTKVLVVDGSVSNVGINTDSPQAKLQVNDFNPVIAEFYRKNGGTDDESRIALGALASNIPSQRGVLLTAVNNGAGHDFSIRTSNSHSLGPTEKMIIKSNGNVGINPDASGPDKLLHVSDSNNTGVVTPFRLTNVGGSPGTEVRMEFECGVDEVAYIGAKNEGSDIGPLMFATATSQAAYPTEKMRLTNGGQLLIGATTPHDDELLRVHESGTNNEIANFRCSDANHAKTMISMIHMGSGDKVFYSFKRGGSLTQVGRIITSSSSTTYETSSDYRLKENVTTISDGITRLKTLKPYRFNFKIDPTVTVDGFLAHEVTAVPEAISGTKDEVETTYYKNSDTIPEGKAVGDVKDTASPVYQGIDQSKLVPLLTAALQEAITKIETLETKVAALEGG